MEVRIRYKDPDGDISEKIVHPISQQEYKDNASENFCFASAVAEFGMLLSESEYKGTSSFESVKARASKAMGDDSEGYRKSFIELVEAAESFQRKAD
jgi:Ca-activated chloride channel family protein